MGVLYIQHDFVNISPSARFDKAEPSRYRYTTHS
ncbi:MAG: hypothetical protein ACI8XM_000865 [Haloarculaceae archaeon]|jgi:hypothetical protein